VGASLVRQLPGDHQPRGGPTDFNGYSITAPSDSRLPNGGGYPITGLYDVTPAKFGQVNNLVSLASTYGTMTEQADFLNVTVNARLPHEATLAGGFDTGRSESTTAAWS